MGQCFKKITYENNFLRNPVHRPATILPPPLIYFAGLVGAWGLNHVVPMQLELGPIGDMLGWGLIALGLAGFTWALWAIGSHRTTVNPYKAATTLVTTGPFQYSRNPIYVSDWLVYAGITLLLQSAWPIPIAPLVWLLMRYAVIRHEEAHLQAKFGTAYTDYCKSTRRWL